MLLLFFAALPALIFCSYIYRLDRYEKEPMYLLILSLFYGSLLTAAIIPCEVSVIGLNKITSQPFYGFYMSFIAIAPIEEGFKLAVLFLLCLGSNLNEPYDGIVYAVFVSLGFALVENIFYVFNPALGGWTTAFMRALFSVPGHGMFGIAMGYMFSLYALDKKRRYLILSFLYPYMLHAVYDFIIFVETPMFFVIFLAFIIYLICKSAALINKHIQSSPFK